MIVFDLTCDCGYTFEGWFQDRQDFDKQQTAAFLVCPVCGGREVRKILSPIRAQSFRNTGQEPSHMKAAESKQSTRVADSLETLQEFVEKNFEDVGTELATESLKIHYGVSKPRNIRGVKLPSRQEINC
jgi:hypothetical protein